jgi:hypothetical protein
LIFNRCQQIRLSNLSFKLSVLSLQGTYFVAADLKSAHYCHAVLDTESGWWAAAYRNLKFVCDFSLMQGDYGIDELLFNQSGQALGFGDMMLLNIKRDLPLVFFII